MKHFLRLFLFPLFLLTALAACKRGPEALPPDEIVKQAAGRMKALQGFHFSIERSGAPAYIDAGKTISLSRMEGDFTSPDRAQASVRVILPGVVAEVNIRCIGEEYWETNLLTGEWVSLPAGQGFNPAVLFDPEIGLQPLLQSDLADLAYSGLQELEEMPGQKLYVVTGKMSGEHLFQMSYGLIGPESVDVTLWVAPQTFEVYRIQMVEPAPQGATGSEAEATTWKVDFWDFDKVIDIQPPAVKP